MKYELTKNTKAVDGKTLYQIRAVKDFDIVKSGDLGGYVESEKNLSQEGNCWVSGNARVFGDAWVYDNTWVSGDAQVFGDAQVSGNAQVFGDAQVSGNAYISGNARVFGNAMDYGNTALSSGLHTKKILDKSGGKITENFPAFLENLPSNVEEITVDGIKYKKKTIWEIAK